MGNTEIVDKIDKAIVAHGRWKVNIRDAIKTGSSTFNLENVGLDNLCDFGKMLYSLTPAEKATTDFEKLRTMHAEFHRETAKIMKSAVSGNKASAEKAIEVGTTYNNLSSELINLLSNWKKSLSK